MTRRHSVLEFITTRDHRLMRRANNWHAPRWIRLWTIVATRGGDGWLWYTMALAILFFGGPQRFAAVISAGISAGIGSAFFVWVKRKTKRRRPCHLEPHCWARLLPPDQFSFPSGHTITAFAVAVPLGLFYPTLMPGLLICAVSIGVSRILLGMHFLSAVLAGAAGGTLLGYLSFLVYS